MVSQQGRWDGVGEGRSKAESGGADEGGGRQIRSRKGSCFQPVCHSTLVCCEWSAGVSWEFGGRSFLSRAIGGCEPPAGGMEAIVKEKPDGVLCQFYHLVNML